MEEEKELLKHVCKFCSKSFGCGRSLGGHMRSHMINDITAQPDGTQLTKKKLPPLTSNSCYVLRENPKKTWRISDHKSCRDCGKEFQSWKALFGHMKCHSIEKDQIFINEEEQESWASVMDSHSDNNETTVAVSNRRKRSQRKTRQVMGTTNTANSSSSMSEIEQEQEEVALCLMMLSRDVGGFSSVAESSDNNSVLLENKSTKPEQSVSGIPTKVSISKKKSQLDDESVVENSGIQLGKRKISENSRFECTTCNKTFHSYQALGGHRASHKKNKGYNNSATDTTENSIETVQLLPDEAKLLIKAENSVDFETKKSKGVHTCPICLKNFPSGQALGGHKRSHLAASTIGAKNEMNLAVEEPIRDFLDLNLPAPCEEDSNGVVGFDQWWNSSRLKHESLLGLISN